MQLRRSLIATGAVAVLAVSGVTAAVANDPPPRIAFLANGIVPADALAAGPIAGQLGAPIYTTAPGSLIESTGVALDAYDPDLVIVMGGPAAISDGVLAQVSDVTGLSIEDPSPPPTSGIVRAAGQDRFETAAAAAALLGSYDPAFLPTDMQAADSDKLDGKDSSAFQPAGDYLGTTEKAADSDTLDGKDSTDFLGKAEKAADSDTLDGIDSSDFFRPIAVGEVDPDSGVYIDGAITYEGNPADGVYCFALDPGVGLTRDDIVGISTADWSGQSANDFSPTVQFRTFPIPCDGSEFGFFAQEPVLDGENDWSGRQGNDSITFGFLIFAEPSDVTPVGTAGTTANSTPPPARADEQ